MARSYVVLDTESSVCERSFRRILVSIAYEVVDVHLSATVRESYYDIVQLPPDAMLDFVSEQIHGITLDIAREKGRPLLGILQTFLSVLQDVRPYAIVGHDIANDIQLLVNEAIHVGIPPASLCSLRTLLCTKELSIALCRLPLPQHLQYENPGDIILQTLNDTPPRKQHFVYKWPSLQESYCLLVKKNELPPNHHAHDARGDVERCRAVLVNLLLSKNV